MQPNRETLLCHYHYDPLDQLTASSPAKQANIQRFYLKDRLATEIQGTTQRSIFQHDDQLVAQQQRQNGNVETRLLATDQKRSVLNSLDSNRPHPLAFPPYGHCAPQYGLLSLLSFNGEQSDPITGHYLLGKGYRAFNPVLMRFNSPDSWSPFGEGGLNAYAYCIGDPVNRLDPSGHASYWSLIANNLSKAIKTAKKSNISHSATFSSGPFKSSNFSKSAVNINSEKIIQPLSETNWDFIGYHGSTTDSASSLLAGLDSRHMNSASGLSSGKGFYVSPTLQTAIDFSEVAASYIENGKPQIFEVHVKHFTSMRPGVQYRFATMGEGGLRPRKLNEMEILLREPIYKAVSIRTTGKSKKTILPRGSEAPF